MQETDKSALSSQPLTELKNTPQDNFVETSINCGTSSELINESSSIGVSNQISETIVDKYKIILETYVYLKAIEQLDLLSSCQETSEEREALFLLVLDIENIFNRFTNAIDDYLNNIKANEYNKSIMETFNLFKSHIQVQDLLENLEKIAKPLYYSKLKKAKRLVDRETLGEKREEISLILDVYMFLILATDIKPLDSWSTDDSEKCLKNFYESIEIYFKEHPNHEIEKISLFKSSISAQDMKIAINLMKDIVNKEQEEKEEQEENSIKKDTTDNVKEPLEDSMKNNQDVALESVQLSQEESCFKKLLKKDEEQKVFEEVQLNENANGLLFTKDDQATFLIENQNTKSELLEKFIKKLNKSNFMNKKQVKSDKLFEGIEDLYCNFPHFSEVIEYLEDYCYLQNSGDGVFYVPPTLLVGDAGVGKTFFIHELANLIDTHFELINMESMTAAWVLAGSSSSWNAGMPGKVFNSLMYKENLNPILLLDELDKCMVGNYPPENTLLPLLENFTAKNFKDECIPLKIDASKIIWFGTANKLQDISGPIKSRFNIFEIPSPSEEQKKSLIKNIYKSVLNNNSWGHNFNTQLSDEVLSSVAQMITPNAARDLRKVLTFSCAKAIRANRKDITVDDLRLIKKPKAMGFL